MPDRLKLRCSVKSAKTTADDAEVQFVVRLDAPDPELSVRLHNFTGKRVRLGLVEEPE